MKRGAIIAALSLTVIGLLLMLVGIEYWQAFGVYRLGPVGVLGIVFLIAGVILFAFGYLAKGYIRTPERQVGDAGQTHLQKQFGDQQASSTPTYCAYCGDMTLVDARLCPYCGGGPGR